MELDDLKYQLKNKLSSDKASRSQEDIAALLTKKTSSVTGKLKRSLRIEIICCIIIIIAFGYIGIAGGYQSLRIYFSVFAVLGVAFLALLVYLYRRIFRISGTSLPVKSNLQTIVKIIEEFVKRYFQFTMALIPVCFIFSLLLIYNDPHPVNEVGQIAKSHLRHPWRVTIFLFVYMSASGVGIYYFTKWYLKKLYGKYLIQLKECIEELAAE